MSISLDLEKCTGCGDCVTLCPFNLIEIINDKANISEGCTLCGACEDICESQAITISEVTETIPLDESYRGIWVFAEQKDGNIKRVSYELLSKGRELADKLQTELCAVCFGHNVNEVNQLIHYKAYKVYLVDNPYLGKHLEELYVYQLTELIALYKPEIVIAGATSLGRSFIPQVAARLKTGLTADCTGLEIDNNRRLLLQTRPTFGGNVMATITCPSKRPQMATVRPRVFKRDNPNTAQSGQVIQVDFNSQAITSRTKLIQFIEDLSEQVKLEDADIIISGGRGLEKAENFGLLEELGELLGAAIGSSRPPVDDGWIKYSHQVGQTGKTVSPKLYIACGISGAVQHLAGMQTTQTIVAINNDPNAAIFEVATYGIVGDLFKVVPMMIAKLEKGK
jgi:electron transfer flavoprotein alpha subunit